MKLLIKINNRYIVWSLLVMVLSGIVIYFTLKVVIRMQMDERLAENLQTIEEQLEQAPETVFFEPSARVRKINRAPESLIYSDTLVYNEREQEYEEYRQISVVKQIGGNYYHLIVRKSNIESEDLLGTLALVTLSGILLLWIILLAVNRQVAKSVWQPFFANLKIIEKFTVSSTEPVKLISTGISEFDQLNEVVSGLSRQIISDFQNQKQFSEDVSHEMQTPLAIFSARLESLLNDPDLTDQQAGILKSTYSTVHRLSKLNKALILLNKIDNNQFNDNQATCMNEVAKEKLNEISDLIRMKNLRVETSLDEDFILNANPDLAGILINNLLSNGINHTEEGGVLRIMSKEGSLSFCNSGSVALPEPEKLFNRFYKADPSSGSLGLGLAIAKKICEQQKLEISYQFSNNMHCFTLQYFPERNSDKAESI